MSKNKALVVGSGDGNDGGKRPMAATGGWLERESMMEREKERGKWGLYITVKGEMFLFIYYFIWLRKRSSDLS